MRKKIKAWALVEKSGGRKGKFVFMDAAPSWYPLRAALYATRNDALRFIRNSQSEHRYDIVRIQITIAETTDEQHGSTLTEAD